MHSVYTPGAVADRRLLGRDARAALRRRPTRPRSVAILGNAAGTTARAIGALLPRRSRSTPSRSTPTSPRSAGSSSTCGARTSPPTPPTPGPGCQARPRTVRRDHGRRLPPALHPVLPGHPEFFDVVARAPEPGRRGDRSTSATRASSDALEKVLTATMAASFGREHVRRDPVDDTNTILLGTTSAADPADRLRAPPRRPGEVEVRARRPPPTGSPRACAAAPSTPTTGRRSSGWSTPRSPRSPSSPGARCPRGARRTPGRRRPVVVLGGAGRPAPGHGRHRLPLRLAASSCCPSTAPTARGCGCSASTAPAASSGAGRPSRRRRPPTPAAAPPTGP